MIEHIRYAFAHNDTGTSAVLCLQLILTQHGDTGTFSLDCSGVLRFFVHLKRESSMFASKDMVWSDCNAVIMWPGQDSAHACDG